ncbi:MAG: UvrD-helicase domain-containing protein [Phycisphaerales bacterium]
MQPTIALGSTFLDAFAEIPRSKQRKVTEFVSKFRDNPQSSGINYEKINDARDANFRSVRIDQDFRGIVLKPDSGNVYVLLWVDKHDDAYDWARRNRCHVNPTTGVLQLFEVDVHIESGAKPAPVSEQPSAAYVLKTQMKVQPLFSLDDETLKLIGVPDDRLTLVRGVCSEDQLEALEKRLPVEAFEALYMLAAGTPLANVLADYAASPERKVDASDYIAALQHPGSQRGFHVVEDEMELIQMLEAPLERWRVFLHPSQRQLVVRNWNGPVRVLGGAGTGKTVVAMHRARWLAENVVREGERILFTTFTHNLATDISNNLRKICTFELFQRIEVQPLNEWVSHFLKRQGYTSKIVYPGGQDGHYEACWQSAIQLKPEDIDLPPSFYREEWERVVLPQRVLDRIGYLKASRNGRGVALNRKQRSDIWPVFEEMRAQLAIRRVATAEDAMHHAIDVLDRGEDSRQYRCVLVDEAQDFGPEALTLVRRLAPEQTDDLFLVGDGHQRIYQRKTSLSQCGINIRGRGRKLRINYRTTEQIRRFATALLEGVEIDDLDGGADGTTDYRSLVQGMVPEIYRAANTTDEEAWLTKRIRELEADGLELADICLVARTQYQLGEYESALIRSGLTVCRLSRDQADERSKPGVRLATMHRVKGLEFKVVLMAGINQGVVPLSKVIEATDDPVERRLRDVNERALFHVAATRAVRYLLVSCSGTPSEYLARR